MAEEFDPISLEILWSRLISIADESAAALLRTSFSTIVRESNDFATVLMDASGDSLAENTVGIPSFVGMLPRTLREMFRHIPKEDWRPGDCVITNDPWMATGHLLDITMVAPVFHRGRLVAFSGSTAHLPDIGGSLWAADCRELFEEGLRILPSRFLVRGDHRQIYSSISKWSTTLNAAVVDQQIRRAVLVATSDAPGPVHIDLPQSETTKPIGQVSAAPLLPAKLASTAAPSGLSEALRVLGRSRRPVLLAGMGVLWAGASAEFAGLAEKLGAPVLTTTKAKGVLPEDHPLSAGCIIGGLIERELVRQSDLIVCVGLDAVELQPKPWPYAQPILSLSSHQACDGAVPAQWSLTADLGTSLAALTGAMNDGTGWGLEAAEAFRKAVSAALDRPATGLSPQRVVEVARAVLPRDTVATCDAGASRLLVVQKWRSYAPRGFLTSNGLASMGYAVPGALAARLAHPDRPVVAFTGDGGFLMAVADIQTSVKEKLPITVVILDDGEIGLIRVKQEIKQVQRYGVEIGGIDWEKLAQGFGADGVVVDSEAALASALQASARSRTTTLIAAKIDPSGYVDQFNALREL